MSYVVLARKWRPMRFSDLVGQDHVARTLGNAIDSGRVAHAFLFTGVRGVGKTTSARILAKALNCMGDPQTRQPGDQDPGPTVEPCLKCPACQEITDGRDMDVQEIDGASYNGVDEVRKLQDSLPYRPTRDRYKIVIVDEVHMLTQAAWNAFLKTLEEPPPHVKFIFATTEVHKVPITILSRVQRFDFKMIPTRLIADRLRWVLEQEGCSADEEALSILARQAAGSMRDAMSLLDQVIAFSGEKLSGQDVAQVLGVAGRGALLAIVDGIVDKQPEVCVRRVSSLADQGFDIAKIARDLLALLRDLVVAKVCADPSELLDSPDDERAEILRIVQNASEMDLIRLHSAFSKGFDEVVRGVDARAGLEMLLVRLAGRPDLLPVDELLHRIAQLEKRLAGSLAGRPRSARAPHPGGAAGGIAGGASREPRPLPRGRERGAAGSKPSTPHADDDDEDGPEGSDADSKALPSACSEDVDRPPPGETAMAPRPVEPAQDAPPLTGRAQRPVATRTGPESRPSSFVPTQEQTRLLTEMAQVGAVIQEQDMELAAYFDHLVPLSHEGDVLRLGMEKGMLFAPQLSTPDALAKMRTAVTRVFGPPAVLELVPNAPEAHADRTLSAQRARDRAARYHAAVQQVRNHPRVVEACRIFGAHIKQVTLPD